MAGVGPLDLHELAIDLLSASIDALDTIPDSDSTLAGAPARSFVAPGLPVFDFTETSEDCDQLTVHVGAITERDAVKSMGNLNNVSLVVTAVRCCFPGTDNRGTAPSAASLQAVAEQVNADKWALWNYIHALIEGGLLFEKCCGVIWGSLNPIAPSGGCGGSVLTIDICFDGYQPVLGT